MRIKGALRRWREGWNSEMFAQVKQNIFCVRGKGLKVMKFVDEATIKRKNERFKLFDVSVFFGSHTHL